MWQARSRKRTLLVFLLFAVVTLLPFLGQAFHIDDRIYLETAENIRVKPLYPYDYPPLFEGLNSPDAASHSHLPLTAYYIALIRTVTGSEAEWVLHMAFLIFPLIAAWSFYDFSRHFVSDSLAAVLLLLSAPAFLVLAHTLMPDVPLLAFWLLALSKFMKLTKGEGAKSDQFVFGLALFGAAFISLLSMGLLLLMVGYLLLWRVSFLRRKILRTERVEVKGGLWLTLLFIPVALWIVWYLKAFFYYDRFVLVNTLLHMDKRSTFAWSLLGLKTVSYVVNIGAVFICPLALFYGLTGKLRTLVGFSSLLICLLLFYGFFPGWSGKQIFLFAVFFASGGLVLWEFCVLFGSRAPTQWILTLWFWGVFASCLILFYAGSVRYTLLALPPVILAWMTRLEARFTEPYFLRNLLWSGVILTLLYALPVGYADHRFAGAYREYTEKLVHSHSNSENQIWFTGEWGFRYYLEKLGARPLARTAKGPKPGDIIIKPFIASPWVTLYDGAPYTVLLEQREVDESFPIRILDFSSHAGFYSTGWGILPFSLTTGEKWEWFNVFRVEREYDGPVPQAERHW